VCGQVASAKYAVRTHGSPTFLNLDRPYPDHIFTALIGGSDRAKFGMPEETYGGRRICVTGTISSYKGVAEVIVHDPAQIRMQ
jgi:hypothetical protein